MSGNIEGGGWGNVGGGAGRCARGGGARGTATNADRGTGRAPAWAALALAATLVSPGVAPAQTRTSSGASGSAGAPRTATRAATRRDESPARTGTSRRGALPLSLREAVARSLDAPAVALARLQAEAVDARTRQARAALLPEIGATAGILDRTLNRHAFGFEFPAIPGQAPPPDRIGPFSIYDARVHLRQPLLDLAAWRRLGAAGAGLAAAEAEAALAVEAAAYRAAAAYLTAIRDAARLSARRADAELARRLGDLARERLEAGVATALDLIRAQSEEAAARGQVTEAASRARRSEIALARALGLDPMMRLALTDSLGPALGASAAAPRAADALALARRRRPELRVQEAREAGFRDARAAIRAERLPRLELVADYGWTGPHADDVLTTREVGVQVAIPLLDGLGRTARLHEQDARLRAAEVREEDLVRRIEAEIAAAGIALEAAEARQTITRERLDLAGQALEQARRRFASGIAGNIELIDAQAVLNQARDARIDADYAAAAARIELARAVGVASTIH